MVPPADTKAKPRALILAGRSTSDPALVELLSQSFDIDTFAHTDEAMDALRERTYHAVLADVGDFLPLERGLVAQQSSLILNTIGEGVCIVDLEGKMAWSNNKLQGYPPSVIEQIRRICIQARCIFANQTQVQPREQDARTVSRSKKFTCHSEDDRYFEVFVSPVISSSGKVNHVVAIVWDATSGKRLQQKINAIDYAGKELAKIEGEAMAKLTPGERLDVLQDKIIRFCKDLMHFDHFAIRLLEKRTNKLELVIAEGLPPEATEIDLYAQPEGNGISGYVAATGRSYICHDTEKDPRYVTGIRHCKSSLTVPLRLHDKIIGVFNIESESVGGFDEDDRQFAEIFGQYVAMALNILDLLVVERFTTSGELASHVVQDLAAPLNDIVTEAQTLVEDYIGDDNMRSRLQKIVEHVDSIRKTIKNVAQGPQRVLGCEEHSGDCADPIIAGKTILIADDEANIRDTVGDILRRHGGKPTICKDGYEACHMLEQKTYDLVISDIRMPHRNGYEIFAATRRRSDTTPVILMTGFGYDPHHSIVRASQEGLSTVLFKPFKVDQLIEAVHKALQPEAK